MVSHVRSLSLDKNIGVGDFCAFFGRAFLRPRFVPRASIKITGVTSSVKIRPSLVGVLIDKEATVVARASVNHEGLNGLVEAKRFKAAAVQRRAPLAMITMIALSCRRAVDGEMRFTRWRFTRVKKLPRELKMHQFF